MGAKEFKINDNCEDLMIWHFDRAITTGDMRYIQCDFSDVIPKEVLSEAWQKIVNEYEALSGDINQIIIWNLRLEIEKLRARYQRVVMGLDIIFNKGANDDNKAKVIELLKTDKVEINEVTETELQRLSKQLNSMRNRITLKEQELKRLLPDENAKPADLEEQMYAIEKITDAKYKLDSKETSVKRFLILTRESKKIVEKNGK